MTAGRGAYGFNSISNAIDFSARLVDNNALDGTRKVIDVSGDGPNSSGRTVTLARDDAVARGVTINGLPIMLKRPNYATMDLDNLDIYYEDCVVGGPDSKKEERTEELMAAVGRLMRRG